MTPSRILLYFCLSFIGGIFLSSILRIPQLAMLAFLIFGILLISVFWKYKKAVVIGFCLFFLVAGIFRHQSAENTINSELRKYNNQEETITLIGVIADEPDVREKSQKLEISTQLLNKTEIKGKVLLTTGRYPEYQYGDRLRILGKLKTPPKFEDFNYQDYLKKEGIYSIMSFPEIELIGKNQGNFIFAKILQIKNKLRESISRSLNPPQSSILAAMILGDKRRMSDDLKEKLNIAGVRHITAVSGMHVAIVTAVLMSLLLLEANNYFSEVMDFLEFLSQNFFF